MKHFPTSLLALGVISLFSLNSYAQRGIGARTLVLDDGIGNTLTVEYTNIPTVSGNSFYNFLPGGGASTPGGTANGQTLWWKNSTTTWVADNFLTNTGSAVGIGTTTPVGLMANTVDNNVGSDARGINANAFTWMTNTVGHGYAASITNEGSGAGGFDGLMVRVWDNNAGTNAFDVSEGAVSPGANPASLFTIFGNGSINMDPIITATTSIGNSTAATNVNITGGNKWSVSSAGALTTVSTANIATGANLTNHFGDGGGTTTNNIGNNGTAATTTTNNIGGAASSGSIVNGIGFNSGTGSVVNQVGVGFSTGGTQNQIGSNQGAGTVTDYWGTSLSGPVLNNFGSTTAGSTNTYFGLSNFAGSVEVGSTHQFTVDNSGNVSTSGTATIGGGTPIVKVLSETITPIFVSTPAQSSLDVSISFPGVNPGDGVILGVPSSAVISNSCYTAWVPLAGFITIRFNNYSTGSQTPASGQTFRVTVIQF